MKKEMTREDRRKVKNYVVRILMSVAVKYDRTNLTIWDLCQFYMRAVGTTDTFVRDLWAAEQSWHAMIEDGRVYLVVKENY